MNTFIHPALWQLTKMRTQGRLASMLANFTQPRKILVSILGTVLAAVWMSNVIASILFREKYDPVTFQTWMTLSLSMYAGWHFVRVCWQRPESSIEWTPAERNNLLSSPFTRQQLVQYRLATVLGVTTIKAGIGTLLLLPDLAIPTLGFFALWCGLALIELIRLIADTLAAGMNRRAFQYFRVVVLSTLTLLGITASYAALVQTQAGDPASKIPVLFQFVLNLFAVMQSSVQTPWGETITAPFALFIGLMTADQLNYEVLLATASGFSMLVVAVWSLMWLDRWSESAITIRQKQMTQNHSSPLLTLQANDSVHRPLPKFIVQMCGGAVVWRQMVGVYRYGSGVILALIPPAILSVMPLFMARLDNRLAVLNFLGGLVFYSFLLLPSALKFDFRRDYSHLLLLKMIPQSPWKVVLGQLVTPIVITTLFQYAMLGVACMVRDLGPIMLLACVVSFPAMNFAVYSWENLMFLIFPQKLKQEGIEVFLRTTVLFTAKGIACAIVFALLFCWALTATEVAKILKPFVPFLGDHRVVFGLGVWCSVTVVGVIMMWLASRQFKNLDVYPETQAG